MELTPLYYYDGQPTTLVLPPPLSPAPNGNHGGRFFASDAYALTHLPHLRRCLRYAVSLSLARFNGGYRDSSHKVHCTI